MGCNLKIILCLKSAPWNWSNCKISWNNEIAQIWDQKCLIWVWAGILQKLLPYLKSAPSNFSNCNFLWKKTKISRFGTKKALFEYLWTGIWKKYCHTWNQRPWICFVAKMGVKIKILKCETKSAWFGYFGAKIWK